MILNLGVIDVPEPEGSTTFEVAEILEGKYGLFSNFAEYGLPDLEDLLANGISDAIDNMVATGQKIDPFAESMVEIERRFKQEYLSERGVEKIGIAGVPTKAALEGKSIRFKGRLNAAQWVKGKRGKVSRKIGVRRPSFIDSGVLQASFKAWVE